MSYYNDSYSYGKTNVRNATPDEYISKTASSESSCNIESNTCLVDNANTLSCSNNGCTNNDNLCDNQFCNIPDSENCCKGMSCTIDPSRLKCICTYLDIIYSECGTQGTPLILPITTANSDNYFIEEKYQPCSSKCCQSCTVTSSSIYTVEKMKVSISHISLLTLPSTSDILINNTPVTSVVQNPNGSLSLGINSSVDNENCANNNCGTNGSVLLNGIGGWSFIAKYELCGKVTTTEGNCKFSITMENLSTIPITTSGTSTFVCPEICIPELNENATIYMNTKFDAQAQLVSPSLSIVDDSLKLSGTLLFNPKLKVEMIKNSKVCLNANIFESK